MSSNKNCTFVDLEYEATMIVRFAYEKFAKSEMTFSEFKKRLFNIGKGIEYLFTNNYTEFVTCSEFKERFFRYW